MIKPIVIKLLNKSQRWRDWRLATVNLTEEHRIVSLMQSLRPVNSGKELIRLGPNSDGGYLVPSDLDGIKACFSPGVDKLIGFERDCVEKGMNAYMADRSIDKLPNSHEKFHFTKKYVGVTTNEDFMTFDQWVLTHEPNPNDDLLLQIDVEGFEYEILLGMSDQLLKRSRIIVVEFHHLRDYWQPTFFEFVSRAFEKLLQTHTCVHNHPNNCCGSITRGDIILPFITEMTFLRNDRLENPSYSEVFPHPLDFNNTENPSLDLPECWYSQYPYTGN